jgi:hypothetical protein
MAKSPGKFSGLPWIVDLENRWSEVWKFPRAYGALSAIIPPAAPNTETWAYFFV